MTKSNSTPRRRSLRAMILAVALGTTAGALSVAAPASASHGIVVTDDVNMRTGPSTSNAAIGRVPRGTSPQYRCWTEGQNISGVNVWFNVDHAGKNGFISSYYDNSSYRNNNEITTKYGIPRCGSTPAPPPSSGGQTNNQSLEIWFGSPVDGTWPTWSGSFPQNHKISFGGDWSLDIPAGANQQAQIFAAPQDGVSSVTARVDSVRPACASGVIAQGGYAVAVGLYNGSTKVGTITIAHVNPSVSVGQVINRWGGVVGSIGVYQRNGCWDGSHAHVEAFNVKKYSCFNGGYRPGQAVRKTNFLGFVGGARGSRVRQACP